MELAGDAGEMPVYLVKSYERALSPCNFFKLEESLSLLSSNFLTCYSSLWHLSFDWFLDF